MSRTSRPLTSILAQTPPLSDAAIVPDGAVSPVADAGPGSAGGGCGCRVANSAHVPAGPVLLLSRSCSG
jgi:hypothetical protein